MGDFISVIGSGGWEVVWWLWYEKLEMIGGEENDRKGPGPPDHAKSRRAKGQDV